MGGFGLYSVDAAQHPEVLARYINDNFEAARRNAKFVKLKPKRRALVVATRDIAAGEEIYAFYGEGYWRARGLVKAVEAHSSPQAAPSEFNGTHATGVSG